MNIGIVVGGKFHAFELAKNLHNKNYLSQIVTSYPKNSLERAIPKSKISSLLFKEIFKKIIDYLPYADLRNKANFYNDDFFDFIASKNINFDNIDILIGWSGFSKRSFLKIKKNNCIKILERGSSHIEFQYEILKNEYIRLGMKPNLPSNEIINKELYEYELADYICVPSNFSKKTFIEKGFEESKIKVIHLGVDTSKFFPINKKKNENFSILSTGEVSIRKGSHILLEAFNELNLKNCQLIFVGNIENGLKKYLNKFASNKSIFFLKPVKENQLNKIYNKANIFILNSLEDGFGMVIPQAMSCGLPIITTTNTGASEIIEHNKEGFIIPTKNKEKLKEKIKILYENENLSKEMSKNSLKKINNNFSWLSYGNEAINFYEQIYSKYFKEY